MVRVHAVGRQADRNPRPPAAATVVLGHHVIAEHPPGLADVELVRPVAVVGEFVLGQAQGLELAADGLGHAGVVGQRPHQALLVVLVLADDLLPRGVVGVGVVVVHADVVGGDGEVVVGVGLAVGHPDRVPGRPDGRRPRSSAARARSGGDHNLRAWANRGGFPACRWCKCGSCRPGRGDRPGPPRPARRHGRPAAARWPDRPA